MRQRSLAFTGLAAIGLGLAGDLAISTVHMSARWWPWTVWSATALFACAKVVSAARSGARPAAQAGDAPLWSRASGELAAAVGEHWGAEQRRWRIADPFPLPVRWRLVDDERVDHWANIRCAPARAERGPLDLAGSLPDIARVYRRVPSGRLVVLGAPGAGKTVLAMRFTLDLLSGRDTADPVPVIFDLASWNPAAAPLRAWLARQLAVAYPALGAPAESGASLAAALLRDGRVLPVLDGFDEIASGLHGAAVRGINAAGLPLLLTSRQGEFTAAVAQADVLSAAAVVELVPLAVADVRDYLTRSTPRTAAGTASATRWDPVVAALGRRPGDPAAARLRAVFATPLMVALARASYSDCPASEPAVLLDAGRFASVDDLEGHLLDAFVPAAYQDQGRSARGGPGWDGALAERWLRFLAGQLRRAGSRDLAVWDLHTAVSRRAAALAVGLANFAVFGLEGWIAVGPLFAVLNGAVFALAAGLSIRFGTRRAPSQVRAPFQRRTASFARWFAVGSFVGFTAGLMLTGLVEPALAAGLAGGLALGPTAWVRARTALPTVASARALLRQDRAASLAFGLAVGPAFGVVAGFAAIAPQPSMLAAGDLASPGAVTAALICAAGGALAGGLAYGPVGAGAFGVAVGLVGFLSSFIPDVLSPGLALVYSALYALGVMAALTLASAWGAFTASRLWLAACGRLPWRLMAFLDDAHRRGVLRQSGCFYQFRHATLQDRLARVQREPPRAHPGSAG